MRDVLKSLAVGVALCASLGTATLAVAQGEGQGGEPSNAPAVPEVRLEDGGLTGDILRAVRQVPLYGWLGVLSASIVGSSAYIGALLNQMRRDQRQAFEQADRREFEALTKHREKDVAALLSAEEGWRELISQIAADATATGVVVDDAGILNATINPTPYFTVRAADGREFYFTVDPKKLQAARVTRPGSPVLDVSRRGSMTAAVDLQLLWNHLTEKRRLASLTLPRHARWFCIVKYPETAASRSSRTMWTSGFMKR
jgi:hypothetical protein